MALNPGLYTTVPPGDEVEVPALVEGVGTSDTPPYVWDLASMWWWEFTAPTAGDYTFDTVDTTGEGTRFAVLADIRQVENGAPPWQQMFAGWEPPIAPGAFFGETGFTVLRLAAGARIRVGYQAYSTEDGESASTTVLRVRVRLNGAAEQPRIFQHVGTNSGTSSPIPMPPGTIPGDWLILTVTGARGDDRSRPTADCERDTLDVDHPYMDLSTVVTFNDWTDDGPVAVHVIGRIREDIEAPPAGVSINWPETSGYNRAALTTYRVRSGNFTGVFKVYAPFSMRTRYAPEAGTSWQNIIPLAYDGSGYVVRYRAPTETYDADVTLASLLSIDTADWNNSFLLNPDGVTILNGGGLTHAAGLDADFQHDRDSPNGGEAPGNHEGVVYGIDLDTDWWWVPPGILRYPVRQHPRRDSLGRVAAPHRVYPAPDDLRRVGGIR